MTAPLVLTGFDLDSRGVEDVARGGRRVELAPEAVGRMADGVVVGSALVEILGRDGVAAARSFLDALRDALDGGDAR